MTKVKVTLGIDTDLRKWAGKAGINLSRLLEQALHNQLETGELTVRKLKAELQEAEAKTSAIKSQLAIATQETEKKAKKKDQVNVQALLTHLHKQVRLGKIEQGDAVIHIRTKLGLTPLEGLKLYESGLKKCKK